MSFEEAVVPDVELEETAKLVGHGGWVTSLATNPNENQAAPTMLLSASRDKTLIVWQLDADSKEYGKPLRRFKGHNHFIQDVCISSCGGYGLTGSWDGTLRLWNLSTGKTRCRFNGHTKDVLSVNFSYDNRQIISGSRDKNINIWNTVGDLHETITAKNNGHSEWVSAVRFSPTSKVFVSGGWDKVVKVWNIDDSKGRLGVELMHNFIGHTDYINTVAISPEGSLCCTGGKDGSAILWGLHKQNDSSQRNIAAFECEDVIHSLVFSPNRYWLTAATASSIQIWDLQHNVRLKKIIPNVAIKTGKKAIPIQCISLVWSANGTVLFAGFTDNVIRVYTVTQDNSHLFLPAQQQ